MFATKKIQTACFLSLIMAGCGPAIKQIDVMPPEWKANPERTAIIAPVGKSTVIVTKKGNDRIFKLTLESLHLGPATVEHFDLYWITPLTK